MPDIAKKIRVRKRREIGNLAIRARIERSLEWQDDNLRKQSAYLSNFEAEIKIHFYSVKHDYSPEYRDLIEKQLQKIAELRGEMSNVRDHIKQMKEKAKAGEI